MKGIIFRLEKFPGNETFRIEVEFPFPVYWTFNFSVTVMKKLLKALAIFVASYDSSSFASMVGTCSTECTFPVPFFITYVPCCFYLVIRFCYKSSAWIMSYTRGHQKVMLASFYFMLLTSWTGEHFTVSLQHWSGHSYVPMQSPSLLTRLYIPA
jgi:hypothetical protein